MTAAAIAEYETVFHDEAGSHCAATDLVWGDWQAQ